MSEEAYRVSFAFKWKEAQGIVTVYETKACDCEIGKPTHGQLQDRRVPQNWLKYSWNRTLRQQSCSLCEERA